MTTYTEFPSQPLFPRACCAPQRDNFKFFLTVPTWIVSLSLPFALPVMKIQRVEGPEKPKTPASSSNSPCSQIYLVPKGLYGNKYEKRVWMKLVSPLFPDAKEERKQNNPQNMWQEQPNKRAHSGLLSEPWDGKWWTDFALVLPSLSRTILPLVSQGAFAMLTLLLLQVTLNPTAQHNQHGQDYCHIARGNQATSFYWPKGFSNFLSGKSRNLDRGQRRHS